jgi:signal transduction histidine kinase
MFDLVTTTGLSSLLDDLAVWSKDPKVEETVRIVAQSSRSLAIVTLACEKGAAVVSALRTQVQSGPPQELRPLELRRQIDQALSLLENKTKHGIRIELSSPGDVWILGDPNELGKVWLNLMLNAVQAMDGTGILTVELSRVDGSAVVEVRDTGPGIPAAILPRIFEPFFTTKPTGMGLGLEITRRVVEQHRGTVRADSAPGWTVFRVILPEWTEGLDAEPSES